MAKGTKSAAPAPTSKTPKFYSYDGTDRSIDLPDGRTAIVGVTPRELPPAFWKAALRNGCGSTTQPPREAMRLPDAPAQADAFRRRAIIERAISDALAQEPEAPTPEFKDAVTLEGQINMQWLNQHVGFTVERSERDEAYRKVIAEAASDEEEGGQTADENDLNSTGGGTDTDEA